MSSRYPSADRRRGPVRHQGRGISGTPPRRQRPAVLQYLVRHRDQQRQGMARHALDVAGGPGPSRRSPMAMYLPVTGSGLPAGPAAPGELAVPISGSPAPAAAGYPVRRRWPSSSSAAAFPFGARSGLPSCTWCAPWARARDLQLQGLAMSRPGRRRPSRAIEALPMAMSLPGTGSGLPAGPAAPGELAVPISSSPALSSAGITMATTSAGTGQAPKGKGSAGHRRAGSGPAFCSTWYATGISTCSGTDQQFGGTGRSRSDMFRRVAKTQR